MTRARSVSVPPILARIPGQDGALAFLARSVSRPHHAYLFAGPEGSGKLLAARAFAATLLCSEGGCGECRDCRLAEGDRHPNLFLLEPEGRDIRVGDGADDHGTARWLASQAYLTPPEPGRKVFRVEEADRLTEEAADVLLKVLEEPPLDTVFILSSARPNELPETIRSRCHTVWFRPLAEEFVVDTLVGEGVGEERSRLAARLSGGNVGRARRIASAPGGLVFRDAALPALEETSAGPSGALAAAERLTEAAKEFRKRFAESIAAEVEPYSDPETGEPLEQFRTVIRRISERHKRRERRAEREFLDWSLIALESWFRDALLRVTGGSAEQSLNVDLDVPAVPAAEAARAMSLLEEARAALADETNLNPRLVVENAFLRLGAGRPARTI